MLRRSEMTCGSLNTYTFSTVYVAAGNDLSEPVRGGSGALHGRCRYKFFVLFFSTNRAYLRCRYHTCNMSSVQTNFVISLVLLSSMWPRWQVVFLV